MEKETNLRSNVVLPNSLGKEQESQEVTSLSAVPYQLQTSDSSKATNLTAVNNAPVKSFPSPTYQLKDSQEQNSELTESSDAVQMKASEGGDEGDSGAGSSGSSGAGSGDLPNDLQSGIESLSGIMMNDVKVNYNSSKPAQLKAHAYAQGSNIEIGPGQEKHLPHEAWHVVQQKQGRVKPTTQLKGKVNVNDDAGLEKEADVMGAKALQMKAENRSAPLSKGTSINSAAVQMNRPAGLERTGKVKDFGSLVNSQDVESAEVVEEHNDSAQDLESQFDERQAPLMAPHREVAETADDYIARSNEKGELRNDRDVTKLKYAKRSLKEARYTLETLKELVEEKRTIDYTQGAYRDKEDLIKEIGKLLGSINISVAAYNLKTTKGIKDAVDLIDVELQKISDKRENKSKAKKKNKKVTKDVLRNLEKRKKKAKTEEEKEKIEAEINKVKSIKHGTHFIDISTNSFKRLLSIIDPIMNGDVGSQGVSISFGLSSGLGGVVKVGGGLTVDQTLWIEDDKRIRMKNGIHLNLYADAGFQDIAGAKGELSGGGGRVQVFNSPEQWAAYTGQNCLLSYLNGAQNQKKKSKKAANKANIETQDGKNDMSHLAQLGVNASLIKTISAFADQEVTKVITKDISLSGEGSFLFVGGNASISAKKMDFYKQDKDTKEYNKLEKSGTQKSISAGLNVGPFAFQVTFTKIDGHINPDNDGSYFSLKLTMPLGQGSLSLENPDVQSVCVQKLNNFSPFDGSTLTEMDAESGKEVLKPVFEQLKQIFSFDPSSFVDSIKASIDGSIGTSTSTGIDSVYLRPDNSTWRLLYRRNFVDKGIDASASIPTGSAVNVDLGASVSRSTGKDISIGTDSLAYILTVYSGFKLRKESRSKATGKTGKDDWKNFVEENKASFNDIIGKLCNIQAYSKLKDEVEEIIDLSLLVKKINSGKSDKLNLKALEDIMESYLLGGRKTLGKPEALTGIDPDAQAMTLENPDFFSGLGGNNESGVTSIKL